MFSDEKPHRRYGTGYGVVFWNGNVASDEDGATRAVVHTGPPGWSYPEWQFEWPAQKNEVERLERMLQKAFEAGRAAAKKEIRDVLEIPVQR